jgi:hypothetical protein
MEYTLKQLRQLKGQDIPFSEGDILRGVTFTEREATPQGVALVFKIKARQRVKVVVFQEDAPINSFGIYNLLIRNLVQGYDKRTGAKYYIALSSLLDVASANNPNHCLESTLATN